MPVLANSGPGLGEALARGVGSFLDTRRQKKQDELFQEQLAQMKYRDKIARAQNEAAGIHVLEPGETLPTSVGQGLVNDAVRLAGDRLAPPPVPDIDFRALVNPQGAPSIPSSVQVAQQGDPQGVPQGAPLSRAAAGRNNIPGGVGAGAGGSAGGGSFLDRLRSAGTPERGPRYQVGQGFYIDRQPQWDAEDRARAVRAADQFEQTMMQMALADDERRRKAGLFTGAGVDPARAALYAENPTLAANDPLFMRQAPLAPRNIDPLSPEGIAAAAQRAGAVARAEAPFRRDPNAPAPPRPVQPSEFSNKAALVYPRAQQSAATLDDYFTKGAPAESMLSRVPLIGNYLMGDDAQRMNQAAETVASAILRLESGAAITENEIKRYAQQFLPQPGDSPQVREQKRATLATQLQRLKAAATPSLGASAPANPWRTP